MDELDELRAQIDAVDTELTALIERRLSLVERVGAYKAARNLPVFQSGREEAVLKKTAARVERKAYTAEVVATMRDVMRVGKALQRTITAPARPPARKPLDKSSPYGYFGERGSNSEQAAADFFGREGGVGFDAFGDVFRAVAQGAVTYGVVPIENSSTGAISDVYDLLDRYDLYIIGEKWERIEHMLWGRADAVFEDIETVYSHPQAIAQCAEYLHRRGLRALPFSSTSAAVKAVTAGSDKHAGALAGRRAGALYGAKLLAERVNDSDGNYTRFIVIGRELTDCLADKVSVRFTLRNAPGALSRALTYFSDCGGNLSAIESRPVRNNPGHYIFYADVEGNCGDPAVRVALGALEEETDSFRLLGEYAKACP